MTFRHTRYSVLRTSYQTPILLAIFTHLTPLRGMLQRKRREEWESSAEIQGTAGAGDGSARSLASMNICSEGKTSWLPKHLTHFPCNFEGGCLRFPAAQTLDVIKTHIRQFNLPWNVLHIVNPEYRNMNNMNKLWTQFRWYVNTKKTKCEQNMNTILRGGRQKTGISRGSSKPKWY